MQKTIYVSTPEGRFMLHVLKTVDGSFRKLFRSLSQGKIDGEKYKQLALGWEKFLEKHIVFLEELSQKYSTDYIEKTRQKKMEISLKELRAGGEKRIVSLNSYLGQKLFQAAISTEMFFRLLNEYAMSQDVSLDALLDLTADFRQRQETLRSYLAELVNLEKKVARVKPKPPLSAVPAPKKKIARGA